MKKLALLAALTAALQTSAQPVAAGDFVNLRVRNTERVAVLDAGVLMVNGQANVLGPLYTSDVLATGTGTFPLIRNAAATAGLLIEQGTVSLIFLAANGSEQWRVSGVTGDLDGTLQGRSVRAEGYKLGTKICLACNTTPTISSGFGTSPSIVASNGTAAFTVNVGTGGAATSGVIALNTTATNGWRCDCDDITTKSATVFLTKQTATSTTTCTVGNFNTAGAAAAWVASDVLVCNATPY